MTSSFMNLKLVNTVHISNPDEYPSDGSGKTAKLYLDRLVRRCRPYVKEPADVMVSTVKPGALNFGSLADEKQFDEKSSDETAST